MFGVNAHGFLEIFAWDTGLGELFTDSQYDDRDAWTVKWETMLVVSDVVDDATRIATFVSAGEDLDEAV